MMGGEDGGDGGGGVIRVVCCEYQKNRTTYDMLLTRFSIEKWSEYLPFKMKLSPVSVIPLSKKGKR